MSNSSYIFVANIKQLIFNLGRTCNKLLLHNKVPNNVSISSLNSNYYSQIIDLHQLAFDDKPSEINLRLLGNSDIVNYCHKASTLLLLDNMVIGVTLILKKKQDKLAYVYAVIIDINFRHTWANTYLKFHSLKHLLSYGFDEVAFQALKNNRDALKHVQQADAKFTADNYSWNDYQL